MKKTLILLFMCLLLTALGAAESRLRFGFLAPKGAETSFIGGFTYGRRIDEAVGLDMSMDFYYKSYTEKRKIGEYDSAAGNTVESHIVSGDYKTTYIPLLANVYINIPLDGPVQPYASAGIGWGLLWEDVFIAAHEEHNVQGQLETVPAYDEVNFYNGFAWNIAAGVSHKLGTKSSIFAELFYHGAKMKDDIDYSDFGVTWDEVDMSGIGARLGLRFSYNLN